MSRTHKCFLERCAHRGLSVKNCMMGPQVLNRLAYASTLSHLRRINSPIGREGKLAKPRQLHNSQWGIICPAETPEGQACGLVRSIPCCCASHSTPPHSYLPPCAWNFSSVSIWTVNLLGTSSAGVNAYSPGMLQVKNLALMAYISVGCPSGPIMEFLEEWTMEKLEEIRPSIIPAATKIFVNGVWVGIHRDPTLLVNTLRQLRRQVDINTEVRPLLSVYQPCNELHAFS